MRWPREGLRVLGVAAPRSSGDRLPETPRGFALRVLGLVGLADPLRAERARRGRECRAAGIRVVMITGDYPATAARDRRAGRPRCRATSSPATTSSASADAELRAAQCATATVFARIMPEQKLRIVKALKANGEIVAMTGDGVNDAPSLKAAHIGIAMGGRGTDVAREASSIVLLDDDFGSIVTAVRLGRRIYDNLRKAMGFILAVHVPIAGLALLPLIWAADPARPDPHRLSRDGHRSGLLARLRSGGRRRRRHAPTAAADRRAALVRPTDHLGRAQGLLAFALVASIYVIANCAGCPKTKCARSRSSRS